MSEEMLANILQRSLDAAGIHDADPRELPERIGELRFVGTAFVSQEEYPRRGPEKDRPVDRVKGGGRLGHAYLGKALKSAAA